MYIDIQTIMIMILVTFIIGFVMGVMVARPRFFR